MNLVLKDVEEEYTVLVSASRTIVGKDGKEKVRQGRRQDHRKRRLGQIFVLGSAVVTVNQKGVALHVNVVTDLLQSLVVRTPMPPSAQTSYFCSTIDIHNSFLS
eukprot:8210921-Pyramimonas_sp.AAC.1